MNSAISALGQWIRDAGSVVFFGGAGVSTESGIPDFRSVDGLYNQTWDYPPETILSHSFFMRSPEAFYRFYREKLMARGVKPNAAHMRLAELEREGKLRAVITQNIDGLHQMAGSENVLELHGSAQKFYCMQCRHKYGPEYIKTSKDVPRCQYCGGIVRPDVVLYEERLDAYVLRQANEYIQRAEVLIVGGTSLAVYPAAGLLDYYNGDKLVLINRDTTAYDGRANILIHEKIGEVFSQV